MSAGTHTASVTEKFSTSVRCAIATVNCSLSAAASASPRVAATSSQDQVRISGTRRSTPNAPSPTQPKMTSRAESGSSRKELISLDQLHDSVAQTPPLHEAPLQKSPLQVLALQVLASHELLEKTQEDQVLALQESPLQVVVLQESPLQASPLQVLAFQSPPDQDFACASSQAISAATNVEPMMSRSPSSTTPPIEMWSSPRASSSEPIPVEGTQNCLNVGRGAARAAESWSSPSPMA